MKPKRETKKRKRFSTSEGARSIATKRPDGDGFHKDEKTPALYLRIQRELATWVIVYRHKKEQVWETLGHYTVKTQKGALTLAQARAAAIERRAEVRKLVAEGVNPKRTKDDEDEPLTIEQLVERFGDEHLSKLRSSTDAATELRTKVLPYWKDRRIEDVGINEVIRLLKRYESHPRTRDAIRSNISSMFSFAMNNGLVPNGYVHPVRGIKRINKAKETEPLRNEDAIRAAFSAHPIAALVLATGQRPEAVKGARWSEFEFENDLWVIPAERKKMGDRDGKVHAVPLNALAREVLASIPKKGERLFTTREARGAYIGKERYMWVEFFEKKGVGSYPKPLKSIQVTARTLFGSIEVAPDIAERIIDHKIVGVRARYDQFDFVAPMRRALDRWDRELRRILGEKKDGKVLPIRR